MVQKKAPPQSFSFQKKIIHPECVMLLQEQKIVQLKDCAKGARPIVIENESVATYRSQNLGMVRYRVIGHPKENQFLLHYLWNGGGSGHFTGILHVETKNGFLSLLRELPYQGDRCNGGLSVVGDGDNIRITQNLTPVDFLEQSPLGKSLTTQDELDLEVSAASCYAEVVYGIEEKKASLKPLGIKIKDIGNTNTDIKTRHSPQGCFDKIFQELFSKTKGQLIQKKEIDQFVLNFKKECL